MFRVVYVFFFARVLNVMTTWKNLVQVRGPTLREMPAALREESSHKHMLSFSGDVVQRSLFVGEY